MSELAIVGIVFLIVGIVQCGLFLIIHKAVFGKWGFRGLE
jgi:hypothetical protein